MTNNSPDNTKPATHSTDLVLDRVATISDIENRLPDSKEIWYGHSILTSTLFPATPPAEGTDFVSKDNSTVEYILEAGIDSLTSQGTSLREISPTVDGVDGKADSLCGNKENPDR